MQLYIATNNGLVIGERSNAGWRITGRVVAGQHLTSVIAREALSSSVRGGGHAVG